MSYASFKNIALMAALAASLDTPSGRTFKQVEVKGLALVYPPEQPKLSKKAKAKAKRKNQ